MWHHCIFHPQWGSKGNLKTMERKVSLLHFSFTTLGAQKFLRIAISFHPLLSQGFYTTACQNPNGGLFKFTAKARFRAVSPEYQNLDLFFSSVQGPQLLKLNSTVGQKYRFVDRIAECWAFSIYTWAGQSRCLILSANRRIRCSTSLCSSAPEDSSKYWAWPSQKSPRIQHYLVILSFIVKLL